MKQILADIKSGQFKSCYLLYGDETYLVHQYRDNLVRHLTDPEDTMNYSSFKGKEIQPGTIVDLAETMPFFADRRVILIQDSDWFKSGCDQMAQYLKEQAEFTVFVFVESNVDKRNKLYKAVKELGYAAEFKRQDADTLKRWILQKMQAEKKKLTAPTLELFLAKTGDDMNNIANELEKLFSYTYGREVITSQDVETICTGQVTGHIFDMIEAIGLKEQQRALSLYYDLLALKEPPMRILFLLGRQFNLLMQVKELRKNRTPDKQIAEKTGLNEYVMKKFYYPQAARFSREELYGALDSCVETDEAVKNGKITDRLGVEILIIRYSSVSGEFL